MADIESKIAEIVEEINCNEEKNRCEDFDNCDDCRVARILALIAADRAEEFKKGKMLGAVTQYEKDEVRQAGLVEALKEARLQIEYLDDKFSAGHSTTATVLAKIDSALKEGK